MRLFNAHLYVKMKTVHKRGRLVYNLQSLKITPAPHPPTMMLIQEKTLSGHIYIPFMGPGVIRVACRWSTCHAVRPQQPFTAAAAAAEGTCSLSQVHSKTEQCVFNFLSGTLIMTPSIYQTASEILIITMQSAPWTFVL